MLGILFNIVLMPLFHRSIVVIITCFYRKIFKRKAPIVDGEVVYPVANAVYMFWLIIGVMVSILQLGRMLHWW